MSTTLPAGFPGFSRISRFSRGQQGLLRPLRLHCDIPWPLHDVQHTNASRSSDVPPLWVADPTIVPVLVFVYDKFARSQQCHAKEHISDASKTPKITSYLKSGPEISPAQDAKTCKGKCPTVSDARAILLRSPTAPGTLGTLHPTGTNIRHAKPAADPPPDTQHASEHHICHPQTSSRRNRPTKSTCERARRQRGGSNACATCS